MQQADGGRNDSPTDRQFATKHLIVAERHFRRGRFREAATEAGKALQLVPDPGTNPATAAIFDQLQKRVQKARGFCSEDLEFWLEDERLTDDWRRRAKDLLARCNAPADLANSLSIIADAKGLLREIAAEDGKYHLVASFAWGRQINLHHHAPVKALAFSPGSLLAAYTDDDKHGELHVWDLSRNCMAWKAHPPSLGAGSSLCFNTDGTLLASAYPYFRLRQANTGKGVKWSDDPRFYSSVAFSQEGLILTVEDANSVLGVPSACLWEIQGRPVFQIRGEDRTRSAAFGPAGGLSQVLALGTYKGRIHVWELSWTLEGDFPSCDLRFTGAEQVGTLHAGRTAVMSVDFSAEGGWLAAADGTSRVRVWKVATGELVKCLTVCDGRTADLFASSPEPVQCQSVAFSPADSQHLAVGCSDGAVRVWDVSSGEQVALLNHGGSQSVTVLAFHPDGTLATGGESGRVHLWRRGLS